MISMSPTKITMTGEPGEKHTIRIESRKEIRIVPNTNQYQGTFELRGGVIILQPTGSGLFKVKLDSGKDNVEKTIEIKNPLEGEQVDPTEPNEDGSYTVPAAEPAKVYGQCQLKKSVQFRRATAEEQERPGDIFILRDDGEEALIPGNLFSKRYVILQEPPA